MSLRKSPFVGLAALARLAHAERLASEGQGGAQRRPGQTGRHRVGHGPAPAGCPGHAHPARIARRRPGATGGGGDRDTPGLPGAAGGPAAAARIELDFHGGPPPGPALRPTQDLEIPSHRLLTGLEERRLGRRTQNGLRRLAKLLPETVVTYRRYLQRMADVHSGSAARSPWITQPERLGGDLQAAARQLELSEQDAGRSPKRAEEALRRGAQILKRYRLDPETCFQWARAAAVSATEERLLGRLERPAKALRILRRTVQIMEEARELLVLANFRLILKEVFRYQPTGMERSDLFQEGFLGLHRAVLRFDPARLTRFSTYAIYWIRQGILKALIERSRLIRVPQAAQEELRNHREHLAPGEVKRLENILNETVSIAAGDGDGSDERRLADTLGERGGLVDATLHTGTIPAAVSRAMVVLDAREREVIRRRFGLEGEPSLTLEEVGSSLNLSRERIRQIETKALDKLSRFPELREAYDRLEEEVPAAPPGRTDTLQPCRHRDLLHTRTDGRTGQS